MKFVITGGTGFVGRALVKKLVQQGHEVILLSQNLSKRSTFFLDDKGISWYEWDDVINKLKFKNEIFDNLDGVYNLMGENIATGLWSENKKRKIRESRVHRSMELVECLEKNLSRPLEFYFQASAIGIYRESYLNERISESSSLGDDFLANVCKDWEKTIEHLSKVKRKIIGRFGIVLDSHGGMLRQLLPLFRWGLGSPLGNGKQWMSWISLHDLKWMLIELINKESFQGIFNFVSPHPVTNEDFSMTLARVVGKKNFFLAPPAFLLRLVLGEKSKLILSSHRVFPDHYMSTGGSFHHKDLVSFLDSNLDSKIGQ